MAWRKHFEWIRSIRDRPVPTHQSFVGIKIVISIIWQNLNETGWRKFGKISLEIEIWIKVFMEMMHVNAIWKNKWNSKYSTLFEVNTDSQLCNKLQRFNVLKRILNLLLHFSVFCISMLAFCAILFSKETTIYYSRQNFLMLLNKFKKEKLFRMTREKCIRCSTPSVYVPDIYCFSL